MSKGRLIAGAVSLLFHQPARSAFGACCLAAVPLLPYYTAISGKWHLSLQTEIGPRQYGFDSSYGYLHGQIDPYSHEYRIGDRTWHCNDQFVDEEGHATDLITAEAVRVIEDSI